MFIVFLKLDPNLPFPPCLHFNNHPIVFLVSDNGKKAIAVAAANSPSSTASISLSNVKFTLTRIASHPIVTDLSTQAANALSGYTNKPTFTSPTIEIGDLPHLQAACRPSDVTKYINISNNAYSFDVKTFREEYNLSVSYVPSEIANRPFGLGLGLDLKLINKTIETTREILGNWEKSEDFANFFEKTNEHKEFFNKFTQKTNIAPYFYKIVLKENTFLYGVALLGTSQIGFMANEEEFNGFKNLLNKIIGPNSIKTLSEAHIRKEYAFAVPLTIIQSLKEKAPFTIHRVTSKKLLAECEKKITHDLNPNLDKTFADVYGNLYKQQVDKVKALLDTEKYQALAKWTLKAAFMGTLKYKRRDFIESQLVPANEQQFNILDNFMIYFWARLQGTYLPDLQPRENNSAADLTAYTLDYLAKESQPFKPDQELLDALQENEKLRTQLHRLPKQLITEENNENTNTRPFSMFNLPQQSSTTTKKRKHEKEEEKEKLEPNKQPNFNNITMFPASSPNNNPEATLGTPAKTMNKNN